MTETRYLETDLGYLAYETRGEGGPAVLFWHSLFATRGMWNAQAEDLARDHRVVLIDGPGHGDSSEPERPFTLEDCAEIATRVLDVCEVGRAVWVGLSWGGMVAMRAALAHPERVLALGLFDTNAEAEPPLVQLRNRAMAAVYRHFGFHPLIAEKVRELMFGKSTLARDPHAGDDVLEHVRSRDRQGMLRTIEAVVLERRSILDELHRIQVPALVVVGEEDLAAPPPAAERMAARLPHARLERIPACGHLSALEAPERVTGLIRELLSGVGP